MFPRYTVQMIADMIAEAGKGKFESRHGVPGMANPRNLKKTSY
jgi:hypothetical protein